MMGMGAGTLVVLWLALTGLHAVEPVTIELRETATVDRADVILGDIAALGGPEAQVAVLEGLVVKRIVGLGSHEIDAQVVRAALGDLARGAAPRIAGTCTVSRAVTTFTAEDLSAVAEEHLAGRIGDADVEIACKRKPRPTSCLTDAAEPVELEAEPLTASWWGQVPYRVKLMRGERELDRDLVVFTVKAWRRIPVAARRLAKGRELSLQDLVIERVEVDSPGRADAPDVEGMLGWVTRRALAPGTPMTSAVARPKPEVQSGQTVLVVVENPAFVLKIHATALADGRTGERIPLRNQHGKKLTGEVVGPNEVRIGLPE